MILYIKVGKHKCREMFLEWGGKVGRDPFITFEGGKPIKLKILVIFLQPLGYVLRPGFKVTDFL